LYANYTGGFIPSPHCNGAGKNMNAYLLGTAIQTAAVPVLLLVVAIGELK